MLPLPEEPGRRVATWSLLIVAATAVSAVVAAIVGTFLQFAVFDLEEQELLSEAGVWGYIAGSGLLALMVLPAVVGIVLGVAGASPRRASPWSDRDRVNTLTTSYFVFTAVGTLVFG